MLKNRFSAFLAGFAKPMNPGRWALIFQALVFVLIPLTDSTAGQRQVVKIGLYENSPKIYQDAQGRVCGFWPELIHYIAREENWEIQYISGSWDQGLERLGQGRIDIMPDVAFTSKREQAFLFNKTPILVSWSRIYTRHDKTDIKSVTDLKDKKLAVLKGSVNFEGDGGLKQMVGNFNIQCRFLPFESYDQVFHAVANQVADAGVTNRNFGNLNQKRYNLKKTPIIFQPINVKFALSKRNPMTVNYAGRIDFHMGELCKAPHSVYYQLLEKYFESEIAEKTIEVLPESTRILFKGLGFVLAVLALAVLFSRVQVNKRTRELDEKNRALKDREAHLRTLIETIPDLVWLKDPDGIYLSCNLKFERFFGARQREIIGKTDYDFLDRESADFFRHKDKAAMAANGPVKNEEEITYADDGHKELLETLKTPMYDAKGTLIGILGVARDITERKKMADRLRQAQKMEAIGNLAGGIAHDFNNILSSIIGYTELAAAELDEDRAKKTAKAYLDQVLTGALQATDLVQQILTFSRESGHKKQALALHLVVTEAMKFLRASIPSTIEIQLHIDSHATILADPGKIYQVIMNLCTNAYQAMAETSGLLSVKLTDVVLSEGDCFPNLNIAPGRYLKLKISDTGHGMDGATMEKIFDPYFTTKDQNKGTGLGLSVVFGIVKEHKGYINVYSEPEQGASFHIYFPTVDQEPDPFVSKPAQARLPGTETILIVDDEVPVLESAQKLLQGLGYTVVAASDGREALTLFREDPGRFDLVITDMTMPNMNGFDLSKTILEMAPGQAIVLCTGHNELVNREKAEKAGILFYYEKPIIISTLSQVIRMILDDRNGDCRETGHPRPDPDLR